MDHSEREDDEKQSSGCDGGSSAKRDPVNVRDHIEPFRFKRSGMPKTNVHLLVTVLKTLNRTDKEQNPKGSRDRLT